MKHRPDPCRVCGETWAADADYFDGMCPACKDEYEGDTE